jgi:sigma-54 dependent transcriptional regulator, acetoin dehydrogenase operon transcriptional activator AcoR
MPLQAESLDVLDILRSIPDSVLTISPTRQIIAMNDPAQTMTGTPEGVAVGRPCGDILRSEVCHTDRCPFQRCFAQGETVTTFNILVRDDSGNTTPICINTSPLKNARGEIVGVVETIRTISHINRLIEELKTQRNTVQALLDSIAEGVVTVDRDGLITSLNRAAERILGFAASEAVGRPCRAVLPPELCGPHSPLQETMRTGRQVVNREVVVTTRDGRGVPLSLAAGPFQSELGDTLGAVCTFRDLREIERIAEERRQRIPLGGIIGKHPRMREVFDLVDMIKDTDSTVLIHGKSGTGKGLLAQALHALSPRRHHPFVKVSCAALPETLLESELFGHERGAFTGAVKERKGRFELADKGTLFLDEIGDLSPSVQVKLLRVLQEQEFERVGGSETLRVDVRVIAATHRDLTALMRQGRFREDLFYRLNVIPIHLPPLCERRSDIPLLVESLLERFAAKGKGQATSISPPAMTLLMEHSWPGNVRELENALEHAVVCSRGPIVEPEALPRSLLLAPLAARDSRDTPRRAASTRKAERDAILRALAYARGNRSRAAAQLNIDRTTLWRKMRRLGLLHGECCIDSQQPSSSTS